MNLTVRDLFTLNEKFRDIKIIAGEKGIHRKIKDVLVMEAPDGAYWVKEGDFLVSAGFGFKDNIEQLDEIIKVLSEKRAAGLAIKKGRFIKDIPGSAVKLADELNLPLLELPFEMSYRDLTWPIIGRIINEENYNLKISEQLRKALWQTHNEKYSLDDILNLMLSYINKTVILLDNRLDVRIYKGKSSNQEDLVPVEDIIEYLEDNLITNNTPPSPVSFKIEGYNYLIFVLKTPDEILGYLCIASRSEIYELEKILAAQCIPFLIIAILAHQKQQESSLKLREDFFEGLLLGNYLSESAIEKGAEFFNLETNTSRAVVIISHSGSKDNSADNELPDDVLYELRSLPELKHQKEIIKKGDKIIILYKVKKENDFSSLKKELTGWFEYFSKVFVYKHPKLSVHMGVGNIYRSLGELHKSYQEASLSLKLGPKIFNSAPVFFYNDLKLYHILFLFRNHPVMLDLYRDTVGKLVDYDSKNSTNLVKTLTAFFENNCNINQTSRKLYIHRNTLYNRLERASEITGINIGTSEGQLLFQLALKLKEIYNLNGF